ncbi:MAG: histidinol dehydrogenase [Verrucomicrobiota bacterium]
MKTLNYKDYNFKSELSFLDRRPIPSTKLARTVSTIIRKVLKGGDRALVDICNQFSEEELEVSDIEVKSRPSKPSAKIRKALEEAHQNIVRFSRSQLPKKWIGKNTQGAEVGEIYKPLERVGIYVPGGTAPLVSTALMTVAIAKVAGVKQIVVCSPGPIDPVMHYAIMMSGANEVYQVGGAQAIAALAYGTEQIKPVLKVFGPGNAYVVEAKRQVFGIVGVDLIPGPSEIAVVADETANPAFVASDLLAQAEHGPGSSIYMMTPSLSFLEAVQLEVQKQLTALSRKEYLNETLHKGCYLILTRNLSQALEIADQIAPEHLSLVCRKADKWVSKISNAGAIFIGHYSPVALGDYMAGPSHTLPTGGAGKAFPGLMVEQFMKRTSIVSYNERALEKSWKTLDTLTSLEQMDAHKASVKIRMKAKANKRPSGQAKK